MASRIRIPHDHDAPDLGEALHHDHAQERYVAVAIAVASSRWAELRNLIIVTAKHLEQLKDGRFPIEVLSRGKEAEENEKLWATVTDKIKEAGVSAQPHD